MIEFRNSKYRARFYAGRGYKKESRSFETKQDAEVWLEKKNAQKTLGLLNPLAKDVLFNDLVKEWYVTEVKFRLQKSTLRDYKSLCKRYFLPHLSSLVLSKVKTSDCDKVYKHILNQNLSAKTINKAVVLLKQIFNFAVKRDLILKSPARHLSTHKVSQSKDSYLNHAEINLLLKKVRNEWFYGVILMALNTGMRLGEIAGLQWDMVDFERKTIHVVRNQTKDGLNDFTKTNIKRSIPMNEPLLQFLLSHKKSRLMGKYVFIDLKGKNVSPDHFTNRHFKPLVAGTILENFRFHDLRHTFASHFMMNGGNIYDLQKFLGHTKMEMTSRYAHLCPDYLHDKIQIINFC